MSSLRESAMAFLNAKATCARELNRLLRLFEFTSNGSDIEEVVYMSNPWWRVGRKADEQKILIDCQGCNVSMPVWDVGASIVEGCHGFIVEGLVKTLLICEAEKETR
jgi:hypothetical protein